MMCSTCGHSFDDEYEGLDHDPRECDHAEHDGRANLHSIAGIEYDIGGNNVMMRKECAS